MMRTWVPIPTAWIDDRGLKKFKWGPDGKGSDETSALMCFILIAHHASGLGQARLTYDQIMNVAGLSRAKISGGLEILESRDLISREGRSLFRLNNHDTSVRGWGMLPSKGLYANSGRLAFFQQLHLRNSTELNALKIYLLFAARRDTTRNIVNLSYDKINEYSGLSRKKIPDALTLLSIHGLIRVERQISDLNDYASSNAYRLSHLETRIHGGTTHRAQIGDPTY